MPKLELNENTGDELVSFGTEVKALGDGRVGGYLVRFSDENTPDLTGDYFANDTYYGTVKSVDVYYNHGLDQVLKRRVVGFAQLEQKDAGIWAEAQLEMRDEYEQMIYELAKDGKLGWSSGSAGHLVEREQKNRASKITRWPIVEASLTPTPAEPRNTVLPLKSLITPDAALTDNGETEPQKQLQKEIAMDEKELQAIAEKAAEGAAAKTAEVLNEKHEKQLEVKAAEIAQQKIDEFKATMPEVKAGYHLEVIKDEGDKPAQFKNAGDFFSAVKNAGLRPYNVDQRLYGMFYNEDGTKATGINEAIPSQGGFLVPDEIAEGVVENMYQSGQILARVNIDPVRGNNMTVNAVDETSRASGSRFGGVTSYWLEEGGSITASKPKFRQIDLKLKKVAALVYATEEQLEDVNYMAAWLNRAVPEELRLKVEDSFVNGTGVGMPQGFLNSDALIQATRENATNVTFNDIIGMWARRYAGVQDYVWLCHQDVMPELDALYLGDGATGIIPPRFVDYDSEGVMRMKGKPVLEVEYAQSLGTVGDLSLVAWSQYAAIGKSSGIKAAQSMHVQFTTDEMAFRFTYRVDGQSLWYSALTPMHGSNTQSPFVALAAST